MFRLVFFSGVLYILHDTYIQQHSPDTWMVLLRKKLLQQIVFISGYVFIVHEYDKRCMIHCVRFFFVLGGGGRICLTAYKFGNN